MNKFTLQLLALLFSVFGHSQMALEGFESTTGPTALPSTTWTLSTGNWAVFDNGIGLTNRWGINSSVTPPSNVYQGANAAFMTREFTGAGLTSEDYLATPLVTIPANGQLRFFTKTLSVGDQGTIFRVKVAPSTSIQTNIANYTTVATWTETQLMTGVFNVYEEKVVDLAAYAGQQVYVSFVASYAQLSTTIGGDRWLIDNVQISQQCLVPTNLNAVSINQTSAGLTWTNPNASNSYEIEIIPAAAPFTQIGTLYTGTLPFTATSTSTGTAFTPITGYKYYVRSICNAGNNSPWAGPYNFATSQSGLSCAAPNTITTLPYSTTDNTSNYGDLTDVTQPTACAGTATNYMTGNDVFYSYTPTTSGIISITMSPTATNSGIFVYNGCANVGVTCLAGVANATATVRTIPSLTVTAGQTYIIVISSRSTTQTIPYSLTIQTVNCAQPTTLSVNTITNVSAQLSWANPGAATSWEVAVQTAGSPIPVGAGTTTTLNTNYLALGLLSNINYQYWVRADCGNGTFSAWSGPFLFKTIAPGYTCALPIVVSNLPYSTTDNTSNYGDLTDVSQPNTCTGVSLTTNYMAGNEVFYSYTATTTGIISVVLSPTTSSSSVFVYNGCANVGVTCLGGVANTGTTVRNIPTISVTAGQTYVIVVSSSSSQQTVGYSLTIQTVNCAQPTTLNANTITNVSAQLSWGNPGAATSWEVTVQTAGSTIPVGAGITAAINTNYLASGLLANTNYQYWVRANCGNGTFSAWSGPFLFKTIAPGYNCAFPIVVTTLPYTTTDNTANYADLTDVSQPSTCAGTATNYMTGNDVFYSYTPTTSGAIQISMTPGGTWSGIFVYDGCANVSVNCLSGVANSGSTVRDIPSLNVVAGTNYVIVISTNTAPQTIPYTLNITRLNCAQPTTLSANTITNVSAQLSWANPGGATSWEVAVQTAGSLIPAGAGITAAINTNYVANGLLSFTNYQYWVRADCGNGTFSNWAGPFLFRTLVTSPLCGEIFTDNGGANAVYTNSSNDTYIINPSIAGQLVTVTFTTFDIEAQDSIKVYDGPNATFTLIGTYTGATLPPIITASSVSGSLTFVFTSDTTVQRNGWTANVTCAPNPNCPRPTAIVVSAISQTGSTIAWTNIGTATSWEVLLLPFGSPLPTPNQAGIVTNSNPFLATNLSAGESYSVYVRAICNATDKSAWSNVIKFTTQIANDECINAKIAVVNTATTCLQTTAGSVIGATASSQTNTCAGTDDDDVWFKFVATSTSHIISLNNVAGSTTDMYHVLYSGTCGNLTLISCNDVNSSTTNNLVIGQTYYIRVYTFTATANQTSTFDLCITTLPPLPTCINNTPAGNTCATATPICNLNGYCGNTSATYTADSWSELTSNFCGTIENNSFLSFVATSSSISFDVWVTSSQTNLGIQIYIFSTPTCGSGAVTEYTCWNPAFVPVGSTNITATGLTPGNSYYIMIDGQAGDVCNYVIASNTGIQTQVVVNSDKTTMCVGETAILNASGGNGVYNWTPTTGLNTTTGTTVNFTPTIAGTYVLKATSTDGNSLCPQATFGTKTITVLDNVITTFNPIGSICAGATAPLLPTTSSNGILGSWNPSVISNSQSGSYLFTPNAGQCASTFTMPITVNTVTTAIFDAINPICQGTIAPILPPTSNNGVAGSWLPPTVDDNQTGTYIFTPTNSCNPIVTKTIVVKNTITPTFLTPAPICAGEPTIVLPTTSTNGITGTWLPNIVSNTATGTYTFTPTAGLCAEIVTLTVTVNQNCIFGSYASAVWLTNCATSNFFNTVGTGTSIIGPIQNVFPDANLGTYIQNSNALILRGAEVKTFKTAIANVCSARFNYRVYLQGTTPPTFTVMILPFYENCTAGSFPSGGPCDAGDQKWQKVLSNTQSPINLTAYPVGNYVIEVFYDITGDLNSTTQCDDTVVINNNGNNFKANFTIESPPIYTFTNPTTCNGNQGTIKIAGLALNTIYSVSYSDDGTLVSLSNLNTNAAGEIIINGLNAGNYSNFVVTFNNCTNSNAGPIVLVNPVITPLFVQKPAICIGTTLTALPTTSTNGITGTWSPAINNLATTTYTFQPAANQCATSTTMTINVNNLITPTFNIVSAICTESTANLLPTTSTNGVAGNWSPAVISNIASGTYNFIASTACANNFVLNVVVNSNLTPIFSTIGPICQGSTAPLLPLTSTNGLAGTWSPAAINMNVTGSSNYTFTPTQNQLCTVLPVTISVTVNPAPVAPTVINITQPTCAIPTGSVRVTSPLNSGSIVSDLFISEVTDAETGSLTYIELYNATGVTKNLSNYKLKIFNNGSTAASCDLTLSGTILNNTTNVIKVSSNANVGGVVPNQTFAGCGGINIDDNIKLTTSADVNIDNWGRADGIAFTPNFETGYTYRRLPTATLPSLVWNAADWTELDPEVYNNVGTYAFLNNQFEYNIDGGTYQTDVNFGLLNPGNHTVTVRNLVTGCISAGTVINVNTIPSSVPTITTFSYNTPICKNIGGTILPNTTAAGFTTGGTFTATGGLNINATTGQINIANATPGTYTITYTVTASVPLCRAAGFSTFELIINPVLTPTFTPVLPICTGTVLQPLPLSSNEGYAGAWSPALNNLATTTYTFTPTAGCTDTATMTITVNQKVDPTFSFPTSFCNGTVAPILPTTSNNGIVGLWLPLLVSNTASGVYTFTPNNGLCANSKTVAITVNNPNIVPDFATSLSLCSGKTAPIFSNTSPNGITGTWLPNVIDNLANGVYTFAPNGGQCAVNTTLTVTITAPNIVPDFATSLSLCSGKTAPILNTASPNGITGTWSPTTINNLADGVYTFLPDGGQCAVNTALTVTITAPNIVPDFATSLSLCSGKTAPIFSNTSPNGIVGSWSPNTINNLVDGVYTFTPNPGQCAVNTTLTVTITAPNIVPDFATSLSLCSGKTAPILNTISPNGIEGTWSPNTINNLTDGLYTFTPNTGQCAVNTTLTVTITAPNIVPDFATTLSICNGTTAPALNSTSLNGIAGTWFPIVIDNLVSGSYTFTPNPGQCALPMTLNVTITPATIVPDFATTLSICNGTTAPALKITSPNGIAGTWSPTTINNLAYGVYTFLPDGGQCAVNTALTVTITAPNIVPDFATSLSLCSGKTAPIFSNTSPNGITGTWSPTTINNLADGVYTFLPDGGQCAVSTSLTVTITAPNIVPDFATNMTYCAGETVPVLNKTSPNGIIGSWSPSIIDNTISKNYTFTPKIDQCAVPTNLQVNIQSGLDFTTLRGCENNKFVLKVDEILGGFDLNQASYVWSLNNVNVGSSSSFNLTEYLESTTVIEQLPLTFNIKVTKPSGCFAIKPVAVTKIYCDIQKGISPNGDSKNDYFDLELLDVKQLSIFNRYGTKVYTKTSYKKEWVGQTDDGTILPDGTYFYVIDFKNDSESKTGWIYINKENN